MDDSYTTATRRGLERVQVISQGVDDSDPSIIIGADYRNQDAAAADGYPVEFLGK